MDNKATILCIDDEQDILDILESLLREQYNVRTTTDPEQALAILKQEKIHVIISDQRMPLMMGVDLLKQAREISENTTRILLTGYSDMQPLIGCVNDGEIYHILQKPWENNTIKLLVEKAANIAEEIFASVSDTNIQQPAPPSTKAVADIPQKMPGIIILERGHSIQKMISKMDGIKECGILEADNIDIALTALEMEKENIGLIILDLNYNAVITDFIEVLKAEAPIVSTIVLAESMDFNSIAELINEGKIFRYLSKPIDSTELEKYIQLAIEQYQQYMDNPVLLKKQSVAILAESQKALRNTEMQNILKEFNISQEYPPKKKLTQKLGFMFKYLGKG